MINLVVFLTIQVSTVNGYGTKIFGCCLENNFYKVSNWHQIFSSKKTSLGFLTRLMDPCG